MQIVGIRSQEVRPHPKLGTAWSHGNTNNANRAKRLIAVYEDINQFLDELQHQADPISSRMLCNKVQVKLRGDTDLILLPPPMKYRQIYESYVFSQGLKIKFVSRASGHYCPVSEWEDQAFDNEWPEGSQKKDI